MYKDLGVHRENSELVKWIVMLNKSHSVPKSVLTQIENYFTFYWEENPLGSFKPKNCQKFLADLPESTVHQIYLDYLFQDFIYRYDTYLKTYDITQITP